MAKVKCKRQTKHGLLRLKQRSDLPARFAESFINGASKHGYNPADLPDTGLKLYLENKQKYRRKRIKIYKGYIFVFNTTSNRLITVYKIPEEYIDEFNLFIEKRKGYLNY